MMFKGVFAASLAVLLFTPRFPDLELPQFSLSFVTSALAAEAQTE